MKQTKGSSANEANKGLDCKQEANEQESELKPPFISNEGKKGIQESAVVSKTIKKASFKKTYSFISDEMRLELLKAVKDKKEKIKHVAKRLGINYSSAKSICQVFQKEGRAKRVIVKKKGLREDGANGTNKLVISEDIKVMISLSGRFKASDVDLSSSVKPKTEKKDAGSNNNCSPPSQTPLLTKGLPQLAYINVNNLLKQPEDNRELLSLRFNEVKTVSFNPIMMFPNGHSINVPQPSFQEIRLDSMLGSYPLQSVDPFSSGFQQTQVPNINAQFNSLQTYNNMICIQVPQNTNLKQDIYLNRGLPVQNLPLGTSIYPIQPCFINNQQLNNKPAGNIIFPVIQTHTIGKGRFSMPM